MRQVWKTKLARGATSHLSLALLITKIAIPIAQTKRSINIIFGLEHDQSSTRGLPLWSFFHQTLQLLHVYLLHWSSTATSRPPSTPTWMRCNGGQSKPVRYWCQFGAHLQRQYYLNASSPQQGVLLANCDLAEVRSCGYISFPLRKYVGHWYWQVLNSLNWKLIMRISELIVFIVD